MNAALAVVWISSLYFPADSIGAWGRILAGGYALGAAAAIVLCASALVLRRRIPWASATGLVALGGRAAICIYGFSAWALEDRLLVEHHRLVKMLGCTDVSLTTGGDFTVCTTSSNIDGQLSLRDQTPWGACSATYMVPTGFSLSFEPLQVPVKPVTASA